MSKIAKVPKTETKQPVSEFEKLEAVTLGLVRYLQNHSFRNDSRGLKINNFDDALKWLESQK